MTPWVQPLQAFLKVPLSVKQISYLLHHEFKRLIVFANFMLKVIKSIVSLDAQILQIMLLGLQTNNLVVSRNDLQSIVDLSLPIRQLVSELNDSSIHMVPRIEEVLMCRYA